MAIYDGEEVRRMKADCHMHMILDGYEWKSAIARHKEKPDEAFIRQVLSTYQKLGYTYLRDGGDRWDAGKRAREMAGEYGITYRTPLAPLCKRGHYGAFIGLAWENFRQYRDLVVQHRKNGADFIKIMISGLMDFDHFGMLSEEPLAAEEIHELIHIAHQEGMAVMAHCNGARTAEAAAMAGVDSIEHGAYLDRDALQAMEANQTVWVPTLSAIGNLRGKGRFVENAVEAILDSALANVAEYRGYLAAGTDAGAWAVPHGSTTEEMYFEMAGVYADRLQEGFLKIAEKF